MKDKNGIYTILFVLFFVTLCLTLLAEIIMEKSIEYKALEAKVGQYDKQTGEFIFKCQKCGGE